MASGESKKNKVILSAKYTLGGAEFGLNYEYNFGTFDPDFGGGFVTQFADDQTSRDYGVPWARRASAAASAAGTA